MLHDIENGQHKGTTILYVTHLTAVHLHSRSHKNKKITQVESHPIFDTPFSIPVHHWVDGEKQIIWVFYSK